MRFTSHLDLQRAFERTIRRAGLPLIYSQGFSPHARINIAAPLPLGFTSDGELADIWLDIEDCTSEDIQASLNHAAPAGFKINQIFQVPDPEPSLQSRLLSAEYKVTLWESIEDLTERITHLMDMPKILRQRRGKEYDLKALIEALYVTEINVKQTIIMHLLAQEGRSGRPEEVLNALQVTPTEVYIHRTRLFFREL